MKVEFKVGDVLLVDLGYIQESEIEEIAVKAQCMKIKGTWYKASDITPKIKAIIGRASYKKRLFSVKRTVVYL